MTERQQKLITVYDSWEKLRESQKEQEKRQKVVEMAVQK
jgi:hypothetical protein